jgi:hypothetical protein
VVEARAVGCIDCQRALPTVDGYRCAHCAARPGSFASKPLKGKPQDGNLAYMGRDRLTDKPTLKLVTFTPDRELLELLESDEQTLTGKPVRVAAQEEIDRRKVEGRWQQES